MKHILKRLSEFLPVSLVVILPATLTFSAVSGQATGHRWLNAALQRHVKDGLVDYEGMATDDDFKKYLEWVAETDTAVLQKDVGAKAFWVNLYNALAIEGVIRNMPLSRVIDVAGFFDRQTHTVSGHRWTLNHIEKDIIFPRFKDPRLHFALVCAARSCPPLQPEIYTAENIEHKLDELARAFINDPKKNYLDKKQKIFYLSQIFNWYKNDFVPRGESILSFLKPYLKAEDRAFLADHEVVIRYLEYDWNLNRR